MNLEPVDGHERRALCAKNNHTHSFIKRATNICLCKIQGVRMTVDFMYQLLQSHRWEVAARWKLRPRTSRFQERWLPALGNAGSPFLLALHLLPFRLITRVLTATLWYYKGCEIRGD